MCGHNHRPEIKKFESHFYLNTGDWIESCSAIVELMDGSIQLIKVDNNNNITIRYSYQGHHVSKGTFLLMPFIDSYKQTRNIPGTAIYKSLRSNTLINPN